MAAVTRTLLLVLAAFALSAGASVLLWRDVLGPTPFSPPQVPAPAPSHSPSPEEVAANRKVAAALARPLPEGTRLGPMLLDAFTNFGNAAGVEVVVDWRELGQLGIGRPKAINFKPRGKKASHTLSRMLSAVGPSLRYEIRHGAVVIPAGPEPFTVTKVYDVRDLVGGDPGPTSPDGATQPRHGGSERATALRRDITDAVDPSSWRDSGGSTGSVHELSGQFIVTQTPANQKAVSAVIERARWRRGWVLFARNSAALTGGAAAAVLLAAPLLRRRHAARCLTAGRCARCGYDVRASHESGRCPECGEVIPAPPSRAAAAPAPISPAPVAGPA